MTPLTPENARPGVRVVCVNGLRPPASNHVVDGKTYSVNWAYEKSYEVALREIPGRTFFMERFVLAEPEPEQSLSAVLSSRADGAALMEALRGWYRLHAPGGGPSGSKLIALYNAIAAAGLAPAPPPAVTEQVATLRDGWWV